MSIDIFDFVKFNTEVPQDRIEVLKGLLLTGKPTFLGYLYSVTGENNSSHWYFYLKAAGNLVLKGYEVIGFEKRPEWELTELSLDWVNTMIRQLELALDDHPSCTFVYSPTLNHINRALESFDELAVKPDALHAVLKAMQWRPWTSIKDIPPRRRFLIEVDWQDGSDIEYHAAYTRLTANQSVIGVAGNCFLSDYAKHITRYRFIDLLVN